MYTHFIIQVPKETGGIRFSRRDAYPYKQSFFMEEIKNQQENAEADCVCSTV
jgi:hypothetical protein